jgi:hypothetical protein
MSSPYSLTRQNAFTPAEINKLIREARLFSELKDFLNKRSSERRKQIRLAAVIPFLERQFGWDVMLKIIKGV